MHIKVNAPVANANISNSLRFECIFQRNHWNIKWNNCYLWTTTARRNFHDSITRSKAPSLQTIYCVFNFNFIFDTIWRFGRAVKSVKLSALYTMVNLKVNTVAAKLSRESSSLFAISSISLILIFPISSWSTICDAKNGMNNRLHSNRCGPVFGIRPECRWTSNSSKISHIALSSTFRRDIPSLPASQSVHISSWINANMAIGVQSFATESKNISL